MVHVFYGKVVEEDDDWIALVFPKDSNTPLVVTPVDKILGFVFVQQKNEGVMGEIEPYNPFADRWNLSTKDVIVPDDAPPEETPE